AFPLLQRGSACAPSLGDRAPIINPPLRESTLDANLQVRRPLFQELNSPEVSVSNGDGCLDNRPEQILHLGCPEWQHRELMQPVLHRFGLLALDDVGYHASP